MPQRIEEELRPALESVVFVSPESFLFQGAAVQVNTAPLAAGAVQGHPMPPDPLVRDLQSHLYLHAYCRRFAPVPPPPTPDPAFFSRLSQANRTVDSWEPGWQIYQVLPTGQIYVQKGDRQRTAMPGEYITSAAPGMLPQQGLTVTLRIQRESATMQTGFYYAFGQTLSDLWDEHNLVRIYFHSTPEGIAPLIEYLTVALNRYLIPYRFKTLADPGQYDRTDATVLYFARRRFTMAARILAEVPEAVRERLRPATPLFSKTMLPGIGLAEEPNTGESFGMNRCRMLAEAMVEAWKAGDQTFEGRMKAADAQFGRYGLDVRRPWLNAGSFDGYELPARLMRAAA